MRCTERGGEGRGGAQREGREGGGGEGEAQPHLLRGFGRALPESCGFIRNSSILSSISCLVPECLRSSTSRNTFKLERVSLDSDGHVRREDR